ncbi:MAG: hypothetical protein U1F57_00020 [bacterium]
MNPRNAETLLDRYYPKLAEFYLLLKHRGHPGGPLDHAALIKLRSPVERFPR